MRATPLKLSAMLPAVMAAAAALAQTAPPAPEPNAALPAPILSTATTPETPAASAAPMPALIQPLVAFRDSEVKFSLPELMDLLRDRRHEGWVLAAYPDPKTGRPLIGAGFSLDLPEREHAQTDPLNPHPFVEPSSAELWQAAGLDPALLETVLTQFDDNLAAWRTTRRYRRRIRTLEPQITDDQAAALLRIAVVQAIENARAYCRNFDQLTGPQQMALTQLVYQMGFNLQEFSQFLGLINSDPEPAMLTGSENPAALMLTSEALEDSSHWEAVQQSLIQSQWARLYRVRATAVIAMLDPRYLDDPIGSEQRVAAILHPARHRHRSRARLRAAVYHRRSGHTVARRSSRTRSRAKV